MATKIVDKGWKRIKRELKTYESTNVLVGTFGGIYYAGYVEFGTKHRKGKKKGKVKMAPRPYIRNTFEREGSTGKARIQSGWDKVINGSSAKKELDRIGAWYEGQIKRTFRMFPKPPIDDGDLIGSITWKLE